MSHTIPFCVAPYPPWILFRSSARFRVPQAEWQLFLKRIMDIVVSALVLIILSPVFLVLAALVKFTSPGPVLYEWRVVGFNKRPFKSWKFRTMAENADEVKAELLDRNEMMGPVFKMRGDPRVTRVGRVLRRFSSRPRGWC